MAKSNNVNKAVGEFESEHLRFNSWYSPEIIKYLVHLDSSDRPLKYVFYDGNAGDDAFRDQLDALNTIRNALSTKQNFSFISKESGINQNHFIFGIFVDNKLLIVNPAGASSHNDFYGELARWHQQGRGLDIYISNTKIQNDPEKTGFVSSGPICVELIRHISKLPKEKLLSLFTSVSGDEKEKDELTYHDLDIKSIIPDSLKALFDAGDKYQEQMMVIRKSHLELLKDSPSLKNLPVSAQDKYLEDHCENNPVQTVVRKFTLGSSGTDAMRAAKEIQECMESLGLPNTEPDLTRADSGRKEQGDLPGLSLHQSATKSDPSEKDLPKDIVEITDLLRQAFKEIGLDRFDLVTHSRVKALKSYIEDNLKHFEGYRLEFGQSLIDRLFIRNSNLEEEEEQDEGFNTDGLTFKNGTYDILEYFISNLGIEADITNSSNSTKVTDISVLTEAFEANKRELDRKKAERKEQEKRKKLAVINKIKETYEEAKKYYELGELELAEQSFVKAIQPVLSKVSLKMHSFDVQLEDCKELLLDSMYHLGQIYLQSDKYPYHHAKATAIFQYCGKFAQMHKVGGGEKYLKQAHSVESEFLKSVGRKSDDQTEILEFYSKDYNKHKKELNLFRTEVAQELEEINNITVDNISERASRVEKLYGRTTEFFVNHDNSSGFVQKLLNECYKQLGKAPEGCEFAILGLGSLAGGKMTPYSDLEFMILVNEDKPAYKEYLRNLTKLLHIKIVNLGETMLRSVGIESLNNFKTGKSEDEWFWDEVMDSGFSYDGAHWHACKLPYGREGYEEKPDYELIMTPKQMAAFQAEAGEGKDSWFSSDKHLVLGLRSTMLVDGKQELLDEYRQETQEAVSKEACQQRVLKLLGENIKEFKLKLGDDEEGKLYDAKKTIYRLGDRIVEMLSEYCGIRTDEGDSHLTVWQKIDKLQEGKYLSSEGAQHLKEAVSIATELRMQTYSHNKSQAEGVSTYMPYTKHLDEKKQKELLEKTFYIKDTKILHHFYYVMLPLQKLLKSDLDVDKTNLSTNSLYDNNTYNKGMVNARFLEYDLAIASFREVINSDPPIALLKKIFSFYKKMNLVDESIEVGKKILELTKVLYKDDPYNHQVASIHNNLSLAYKVAGNIDLQIEHCKKGLEIKKMSSKPHWASIGRSYNNLGIAYDSSGDFEEAIKCHQKALKIRLKLYKSDHSDIADTYNNLGGTYGI